MPIDYLTNPPIADDEMMAAIDIGSNSFHLAIARLDHGEVARSHSRLSLGQRCGSMDMPETIESTDVPLLK